MGDHFIKKVGKNASDTVRKVSENFKEAPGGIKKGIEAAPANINAVVYRFKQERKRAPLRSKALAEWNDAMNFINIQRSNSTVENFTEDIVSDITELKQLIKAMAPTDIAELCEELLGKYREDRIPEVEVGPLDARARDNEKIKRIIHRANQLFNNVVEIMSQ